MNQRITLSVGSPAFQQNRIFSAKPNEMRDRANACFIALQEATEQIGHSMATEDLHPPDASRLIIDLNVQKWNPNNGRRPLRYLITLEPPVTYPDNWNAQEHERYDKVFTWNDQLVDNRRYFLLRYAHNLGVEADLPAFQERRFAATISGFKAATHPQEQYSERVNTIRWFLDHQPQQFALYGAGWPRRFRPAFSQRMERFFSAPLDLFLGPFYRRNECYLGPIGDKVATFSQYRFAFCYENTGSAPGYITEKIFDAFRAGCVPVYLGPPNVQAHIPNDCFIDRRQFSSHEQLCLHLDGIGEAEFSAYQQRIRKYLESPAALPFTPAHFAAILQAHMQADL